MTAKMLLVPFVFTCCVAFIYSQAASQPGCQTVEFIEDINKSVIDKRVAHITGIDAKVFVALDPVWSAPEFNSVPYRHPEDMRIRKQDFAHLMKQEIDEVIIWKFRRPAGLAAAVPFHNGCAASGCGEPDELEKLAIMHETLVLISKHGVDDSTVENSIKRLLMVSRYARHYRDEMIDIIIDKLSPLLTNTESSSSKH